MEGTATFPLEVPFVREALRVIAQASLPLAYHKKTQSSIEFCVFFITILQLSN